MSVPLQDIIDLVERAIDPEVVERGRRRQAAVWCGEETDYLPLLLGHTEPPTPELPYNRYWKLAEHELMGGAQVPEFYDYPHYSLTEQLGSPEKMLYEFLWEILSWARSNSDAQLAMRAYILHSLPEAFGAKYEVDEVAGVQVVSHPSKEEIRDIDPGSVSSGALFTKLLDFTAFFIEHAPAGVRVYPADTGGPLATAQAVRGNAIYTDFYDDPEFVSELLDKCAEASIRSCRLLKKAVGEEETSGYHGCLYMARGSVRVVDDPVVSVSPQMHREFGLPCIRRIFQAFGGGWYHSCGVYEHHLDNLLSAPEITAINFGNPELWPDFDQVIGKMIKAGKVYYGPLPVRAGEELGQAFRNILQQTGGRRRGMILMLNGNRPWPEPQETMELWHKCQDELCLSC